MWMSKAGTLVGLMGRGTPTRRALIVVVVGVLMLAVALPAGAGKPECGPDSTHPRCEPSDPPPTTDDTGWWCEDRIANGAIWQPGEWSDGSYLITAPVGCIDIGLPPSPIAHRAEQQWRVDIQGQTLRGTAKGMKLVFERGIHGLVYDQIELTDFIVDLEGKLNAAWTTDMIAGDADASVPYAFVSMPRSGDKWLWIEITVTPLGGES